MSDLEAGSRVTWTVQNVKKAGVIVAVENSAHSLRIDTLMEREPGESERMFGRLCRVRCDDAACQCNQSDWLHAANECQLTDAGLLVDGMLF